MSISTSATATVMSATGTALASISATAQASQMSYMDNPTAIMSTGSVFLVIIGLQILAIVGFSWLAMVPILSATGCAIGNGLLVYVWYEEHSTMAKIRGGVFADLGWLLQEIMLPVYSFIIVRKIVNGRARTVFYAVFYFLLASIFGVRMVIIATRVQNFLSIDRAAAAGLDIDTDPVLQPRLNSLHVGYFSLIATAELWCAVFLIKRFRRAQAASEILVTESPKSRRGSGPVSIYQLLVRGTEIRLLFLSFIGIARAISFSQQANYQMCLARPDCAPTASKTAGQADRFISVFEAMLPVLFYVDMLATKSMARNRGLTVSNHSLARPQMNLEAERKASVYIGRPNWTYDINAGRPRPSDSDISLESVTHSSEVGITGIKRTVAIEVTKSAAAN